MALNATCNTPMTLTMGNNVNTLTMATFTNPANTYTVINYSPFPNALSPIVTTLCSPTGIENVNESFDKFVIKNGYDKLIIESTYSDYSVNVFDMSGKLILNATANSQSEEVSIANLASGIYVVKLNAKGYEQRQKFIKQ
jgi:hypothetical protein